MNVEEIGIDPARALAFDIDPMPIVCIGAAVQDDVGAFTQAVEKEVVRPRTVAATQQICFYHCI